MRHRTVEAALRSLVADVESGGEFPDAEHRAVEAFDLSEEERKSLLDAYDFASQDWIED